MWALLVVACHTEAPDLESLVQAHMEQTGLDYQDCGTAGEPCHTFDGAVACFQVAWGDCTPARVDVVVTTDEGDPITTVMLVEPQGANCSIYQFTDSTQDAFGSGGISTATCYDLAGNVDGVCPAIYGQDCYSDCSGSSDCG